MLALGQGREPTVTRLDSSGDEDGGSSDLLRLGISSDRLRRASVGLKVLELRRRELLHVAVFVNACFRSVVLIDLLGALTGRGTAENIQIVLRLANSTADLVDAVVRVLELVLDGLLELARARSK